MRFLVATGRPGKPFGETAGDLAATAPACGTAACIAGWALILGDGWTPAKVGYWGDTDIAGELLSVPGDVRRTLFYDEAWPEPFRARYAKAKTPKLRAKIAAARIDYLIEEGK